MDEKRLATTRTSCAEDGGLYEKITVLSRCPPFKKRLKIHFMTAQERSSKAIFVDSAGYTPM